MKDYPMTVPEWRRYIWSIPEADLFDTANTMNSMRFVEILQEDGLEPRVIGEVFRMFAARMRELRMQLPTRRTGGYVSFADMTRR